MAARPKACEEKLGLRAQLGIGPCIPPVNPVPREGPDRKLVKKGAGLRAQSGIGPCIPPVNTVPRGGQLKNVWAEGGAFTAQRRSL